MVVRRTPFKRLAKNNVFLAVVIVLLAHALAISAQVALMLVIPAWPPSQSIRHFPFNVIDNLSGVILLPYMYLRRGLPYSIPIVFGGEVCLVYLFLRIAHWLRQLFAKSGSTVNREHD
jgi:hypothetical protein